MAKLIYYVGADEEEYVLIYQKTAFFDFDKNVRDDVLVKAEVDIPDIDSVCFPLNSPLAVQ